MDTKLKFSITFLLLFHNIASGMDTSWWKYTTIYEIFIWSFKDSNGDGIGDIKGVTMMLDHFVDFQIETLYLSPFYESPMFDMGYDVSNFTEIDPRFGTMEDFDELITEMNKRGLKLIIDLVINHSSDEHPWFYESVNKVEPYTDYYIWRDARQFDEIDGSPIPPNNWLSAFEGSAWKWNEKRKQFYLHQFSEKQPDLNLRNTMLREEIKEIINFWLEKGVAGMRLDATKFYIEDDKFRNEPVVNKETEKIEKYDDLFHIYTTDLWESYEFIHDVIRSTVDEFSHEDGSFERILLAEAYTDTQHLMDYYGKKNYPITHFPFNFVYVGLDTFLDAFSFREQLNYWLDNMPKGAVANWMSDNHDNSRTESRLNEEYMDIILVTIMTAPGIACLYYGQEIGMIDNPIRKDQQQDIGGANGVVRDPERLPMQWDDSMNAGFSNKIKPWLPVHPNYWRVNVKAQKQKDKVTRYNLMKDLSLIRKTETLKYGSIESYIISKWVFAFTRTFKNHDSYITILNLGSETELVNIHATIFHLPMDLEVVASSINSDYLKGTKIKYIQKLPGTFIMRPLSALVLKAMK